MAKARNLKFLLSYVANIAHVHTHNTQTHTHTHKHNTHSPFYVTETFYRHCFCKYHKIIKSKFEQWPDLLSYHKYFYFLMGINIICLDVLDMDSLNNNWYQIP